MPKVLRIINRFNLGGPTYNAAYLSRYMPSGYETLMVGGVKDDTEDSSEFIVENLGIQPVVISEMRRPIRPWQDYKAYKKLAQIIADFKPDIVHTHASKPGALGRIAAHKLGVPVIVHTFHGHVFHSYFNTATTAFYKRLEQRLARISTKIIAISEKQKEELGTEHGICEPEKIAVVPLGFDLRRFHDDLDEKRPVMRAEYRLGPDDVAISIIGRLVPVKNHALFLRGIQYVRERADYRVRAFVVGDGEMRSELENLCTELGLSHSHDSDADADVYFTSWVKNVEYVNAGSDIIALTSLNEGTPVSLIEAQASNKPIVSTRVGGIENVVIPNKTALLSEPHDQDTFNKNLLRLTNDPGLRRQFSKWGWDFVRDKFHYTRLVDDMVKLYESLLP
jgi:glycosyltransferase involved in cell wall biosynthesis